MPMVFTMVDIANNRWLGSSGPLIAERNLASEVLALTGSPQRVPLGSGQRTGSPQQAGPVAVFTLSPPQPAACAGVMCLASLCRFDDSDQEADRKASSRRTMCDWVQRATRRA